MKHHSDSLRAKASFQFPKIASVRPDRCSRSSSFVERLPIGSLLCLTVWVILIALSGASSVQAQTETPSWLEACSPESRSAITEGDRAGKTNDLGSRCDAPINLQVLLSASPIQAARPERPPVVCVPADGVVTLTRVAEIFHGYAVQYLDRVYENPFDLLIEALESEFPCPGPDGVAQSAL